MDQRQNVSSGHLSLRRRDLIAIIGGAPILLPFAVRAQQKAMPVIGFLSTTSPGQAPPQLMASFQLGLQETGYVAGQNIAIEFGVPVATEPKVRFSASRVFEPHADCENLRGCRILDMRWRARVEDFFPDAEAVAGGVFRPLRTKTIR